MDKGKIKKKIKSAKIRFLRAFDWALTDRQYLKILFRIKMGKPLRLDPPVTFNEKLQWLKLYNRRDEYTDMVDKVEAKRFAAERIGENYIIPTLGVWDSFDDIDFDSLPDKFVLKTTHGGGNSGVVICRDKSKFDIRAAKIKLEKSLKGDIYSAFKEWPYKNVHRRIFAEELLDDGTNEQILDYKFYCFNGKTDYVMVCTDRCVGAANYYFFDRNWQFHRINVIGKGAPEGFTLPRPKNLDEMFLVAEKLSVGLPCVRVDLYNVNGRVYFGEYTFFSASGFDKDFPPETDLAFGQKVVLPEKTVK